MNSMEFSNKGNNEEDGETNDDNIELNNDDANTDNTEEINMDRLYEPIKRVPLNEIEKTLAKEVATFWKEKTFSDLDIHCGMDGGVIQAHCLVLASLSPIFKCVLKAADQHANDRTGWIIPGII